MSYAIFLSFFAVAAFCGYRLGRLSAFAECERKLRCLTAAHQRALSIAVLKASRRAYLIAISGLKTGRLQ